MILGYVKNIKIEKKYYSFIIKYINFYLKNYTLKTLKNQEKIKLLLNNYV